jgi:hypothetical protein
VSLLDFRDRSYKLLNEYFPATHILDVLTGETNRAYLDTLPGSKPAAPLAIEGLIDAAEQSFGPGDEEDEYDDDEVDDELSDG